MPTRRRRDDQQAPPATEAGQLGVAAWEPIGEIADEPVLRRPAQLPEVEAYQLEHFAEQEVGGFTTPWALAVGPPPPRSRHEQIDPSIIGGFVAVDLIAASKQAERTKWLIRGVIRSDGVRPPAVAALSVEPYGENPHAVTGTVIRGVNVGTILDAALADARKRPGSLRVAKRAGWEISAKDIDDAVQLAEAAEQAPKRGRPPHAPSFYRDVAELALELIAKGYGRGALYPALAAALTAKYDQHVEESTARDYITRARRQEWLEPGEPGRLTFRAGRKLLEHRLLREQIAKTKEGRNG